MPKKYDEPITRIHVHLFTSDLEKLDKFIPLGHPRSDIIRTIIHNYVKALEERTTYERAEFSKPTLSR